MILLFGEPFIYHNIGGCLILVDSCDFEDNIINLEDLSVSINNDLFILFFEFFLLFYVVIIEGFG
jgi:hypothetical protein